MPATFWDRFWDNEYRQRTDIEDIRDANDYVALDLQRLGGLVGTLQRQVNDLSMLAHVLVRLLEESGHIDSKTLRYRIEAELENQYRARAQAGATSLGEALSSGQSSSPASEAPPTTPVQCAKCKQTVPANRTTITELGTVCDQCAT